MKDKVILRENYLEPHFTVRDESTKTIGTEGNYLLDKVKDTLRDVVKKENPDVEIDWESEVFELCAYNEYMNYKGETFTRKNTFHTLSISVKYK